MFEFTFRQKNKTNKRLILTQKKLHKYLDIFVIYPTFRHLLQKWGIYAFMKDPHKRGRRECVKWSSTPLLELIEHHHATNMT